MLVSCCPGYAEAKKVDNKTTSTATASFTLEETMLSTTHLNRTTETLLCHPICRGGCGKGICHAPNNCICDVGYEGRYCSQSKIQIYHKFTPRTQDI